MNLHVRRFIVSVTPPIVMAGVRALRRLAASGRPEWERVDAPDHPEAAGWNVAAVAEAQIAKWGDFRNALSGTGPLGISHEAPSPYAPDYGTHNLLMTFGYVLARVGRERTQLSILDWGGGLGHYYLFAHALLPELDVEYVCKEVTVLASAGRLLLPEADFVDEDEKALGRSYDLVLASGSLHYEPVWDELLGRLAAVSRNHLYVTRLPITATADSYRVLQRAYIYGYDTAYLGWVLNRSEFLERAGAAGLELLREFLVQERPAIKGAPEPCEYRGYLFRRA